MNEQSFILAMDRSPLAADRFLKKSLIALPQITAPANLRDDVRAHACRAWEERARSEYIGVMVVRRFHGLLADVNAPLDLQELALKMLLEEQQHASLCMAAARSLGASGELAFDLSELQQARTGEPPAAQLMGMIVATYCIGEVVALALIKHSIQVLPPSSYRDLLRHIARDEVLHGRIGAELLRHIREESRGPKVPWLKYPGDPWVKSVARQTIAAMAKRDVVEAEELRLFDDPHCAAQLESVGIPRSQPFKDRYQQALELDVPRVFLDAGIRLDEEGR